MCRLWQHIKCVFAGCNNGKWVPMAHESEYVHAYLRQCKRCFKMSRRAFLVSPVQPAEGAQ